MHAFLVILLTDRQTDKHRGQSNLPSPLSEAYDTCSCSLFVLFTQADCSCWQIFSQISHSNLKSFQKKDYFNLLRSQTLNSHFYCAMLCIVRSVLSPGVCLSVTRRYYVETAKHIITLFAIVFCFSIANVMKIFRRGPPTVASNARGMKKSRFWTNISPYL